MFAVVAVVGAGCGDDGAKPVDAPTVGCGLGPFEAGSLDGHAQPLGASATEARAGRVKAADLPAVPSGLVTWAEGDFVLANDRVAIVIEDVGDSDLYDPWGGRPVGLARVEGGRMVDPNNFGELFLLTGRSSIVTDSVSVIADGSDGGKAIVRARGKLHPIPFFEAVIGVVYHDPYTDIDAAIDYELSPGSDHIDVRYRYAAPDDRQIPSVLHALMYTKRTPVFQPGQGFDESLNNAPYIAVVDDKATSWAYVPGAGTLGTSLSVSGFVGAFSTGFDMPGCTAMDRLHAQIVIGGPGLDGVVSAVARTAGTTQREIHGTVVQAGVPQAGVRVHALDASGNYLTRTTTDTTGAFSLHVAADADVDLTAFRRGDALGTVHVGTVEAVRRAGVGGDSVRDSRGGSAGDGRGGWAGYGHGGWAGDRHGGSAGDGRGGSVRDRRGASVPLPADDGWTVELPASGTIHVVAAEVGAGPGAPALPVRVQMLPADGQAVPSVPDKFGEEATAGGRLHVVYATAGEATLAAPPGRWEVVVSRGYEYELVRQTVTVTAGGTVQVDAQLERSVSTPSTLCGDFHIHTWRSNDSGDVATTKVAQAVADGVELPVRSDHEWVADFSTEIAALGVDAWAKAIGSIELTSFEVWGHMGVFPLVPDATKVNAGAPKWQTFPTAEAPDTAFATLSPPKVFDAVRARPEAPLVIINHPRGGANYFDYVGFDPATGLATSDGDWDTKFTLVEVFNDSGWQYNRDRNVEDWLGLLRAGRKVFAVGSSDSHGIATSPVGYPRTCIAVGTDDPRQATANGVRDQLAAGHAGVAGGIYVTAKLGATGPGNTTTGAGTPQTVDVTVQAASWIDVTAIEVIVDGHTVDTIPIMPGDATAGTAVRWHGQIPVQTAATGGFVVIAAYGTQPMEPVHPGRVPFGVTEPIFVTP